VIVDGAGAASFYFEAERRGSSLSFWAWGGLGRGRKGVFGGGGGGVGGVCLGCWHVAIQTGTGREPGDRPPTGRESATCVPILRGMPERK